MALLVYNRRVISRYVCLFALPLTMSAASLTFTKEVAPILSNRWMDTLDSQNLVAQAN